MRNWVTEHKECLLAEYRTREEVLAGWGVTGYG